MTHPPAELGPLLDNAATRHILDAKDWGPTDGDCYAAVHLYQLIPVQQHPRPWVVRVECIDGYEDPVRAFDSLRSAQATFEDAATLLAAWYCDYDED